MKTTGPSQLASLHGPMTLLVWYIPAEESFRRRRLFTNPNKSGYFLFSCLRPNQLPSSRDVQYVDVVLFSTFRSNP